MSSTILDEIVFKVTSSFPGCKVTKIGNTHNIRVIEVNNKVAYVSWYISDWFDDLVIFTCSDSSKAGIESVEVEDIIQHTIEILGK